MISISKCFFHWVVLFMLFLGQIILDFLLPKIQFQLECGESFLPKLTSIVLQSIESIFLKAHRLMKALNLSLTTSLTEYFSKKGYYIVTRQFWKHLCLWQCFYKKIWLHINIIWNVSNSKPLTRPECEVPKLSSSACQLSQLFISTLLAHPKCGAISFTQILSVLLCNWKS